MNRSSANHRLACSIAAIGLMLATSACSKAPQPVKGFVLPAGDADRGREVFVTSGCRNCHTITNEQLPPFDGDPVLNIELGGVVYEVKSYGELLTSIVNPAHTISAKYRLTLEPEERRDAQTPMPVFNDVLTVTQLIDLTEYLHSRYEELSPEYRGYYLVP